MIIAYVSVSLTILAATDSKQRGADVMAAPAIMGQELWRSNGCGHCHSVYGVGGHFGPDLTNAISRRGDEYARAIISFGGARMPPQSLSDSELDQMIAYLSFIDATGTYPLQSFWKDYFGRVCPEADDPADRSCGAHDQLDEARDGGAR